MGDIWYMLSDDKKFVYHYTLASTLISHILPSKKLRFSSFSKLNDPREFKNFDLDAFSTRDIGNDIVEMTRLMEMALKSGWKIGCFVMDPVDSAISGRGDRTAARALDLAHERGHSRPRMWAQYAANHAGACIVFDKKKLDQSIRSYAAQNSLQVYCGSVRYMNEPVVPRIMPGPFCFCVDEVRERGLAVTATHHAERHFRDLYLTKNTDWEAEREYRWLLKGNGDHEEFVDIGDSLVGIAIGELFPSQFKPELGRYALKSNVSVATMGWRRAIPQPKLLTPRALLPEGDVDRPDFGW
jgi:hypothetical protein